MRRSARRAELARMTKARLISMCRTGVTTPDGHRVYIEGGMHQLEKWSRDDLVSSIMSAEFPPEVTPASASGRPWEEMTPADFGTDDEPRQWALFPVDSQGRVGGDLFESADSEETR